MTFNQVMTYDEHGRALPVFPFTPGTADDYDPETSAIVRYCVYIESDYDMDGDGKRDLVKAFVQVPRSAVLGNYKAATLYEPRPYCSGVNADGYDHMIEVQDDNLPPFDLAELDHQVPARIPVRYADTMEAARSAKVSDWYFPYPGNNNAMCYQSIDQYDYYLIRGFAVVLCSGFGTLGSDGFEYVGSHYERDGFKTVVEWLHGDRTAYTDRTGTTAIRADWSNGCTAMTGQSYAGTMPFAVATTGVPGLETIIPIAGIADWYSQQNMQGATRYWPKEILNSFLAYYCTSQYGDPDLSPEHRDKLNRFLHQMSVDQLKTGCDYSDFWKDGNYTLNADKIRCSALIIHGLHDENVSTKQFEMMLHSFEQAKTNVKLLLHQGPHITPTMPQRGYGIDVNGQFYHEITNEWLCHYLYGINNGAENRPAVLVQSNVDQRKWYTADSWETGKSVLIRMQQTESEADNLSDKNTAAELLSSEDHISDSTTVIGEISGSTPVTGEISGSTTVIGDTSGTTPVTDSTSVIDTDWASAGINAENFDEKMSTASTNMSQRYVTEKMTAPLTIQGTVRVDFRACLAGGDAAANFLPARKKNAAGTSDIPNVSEPDAASGTDTVASGTDLPAASADAGPVDTDPANPNDVDTLTMKISTSAGKQDDIRLTLLLCDLADESFPNIVLSDSERNVVPVHTVKEAAIPLGGDLPALDLREFDTVETNYNVITRAIVDLCNPESGYEPETARSSITLHEGEYHGYHVYMNATRCTLMPGHRLAVIIGTEDPVRCTIHKVYSAAICDASVEAHVPVTEEPAAELTFCKA